MQDSYTSDKYANSDTLIAHWACGKIVCDCDEQTDNLRDYDDRLDEYLESSDVDAGYEG